MTPLLMKLFATLVAVFGITSLVSVMFEAQPRIVNLSVFAMITCIGVCIVTLFWS